MPVNPVAENVFGTLGELVLFLVPSIAHKLKIGVVCWTIQLIPQIWKSWREKSTEGLSHLLVYEPIHANPFWLTAVAQVNMGIVGFCFRCLCRI
jgi:PQ loop repeat